MRGENFGEKVGKKKFEGRLNLMLQCKGCKGKVDVGSPEFKICPFCGKSGLVHIDVKAEVEIDE